jgi:hypothetical protein
VLSIERAEKRAKGDRDGERLQGVRTLQPTLLKCVAQARHEFPAKDLLLSRTAMYFDDSSGRSRLG